MTFEQLSRKMEQVAEERQYAKRAFQEARQRYDRSEVDYAASLRAQVLIQQTAEAVQSRAYGCVAQVVSKVLQTVFDEPYEFVMQFERKRGRTEVVLSFMRNGHSVDPVSASGGGVIDVCSFALRLVSILMLGGRGRRLLVLDEPFKFLSSNYRDRVRDMLETIVQEMGFQIIMVTHIDEFRLGTVVDLG